MDDQQNTAAGDEAIGHIEHCKIHKIHRDHIHHVAEAKTVDHIADATAIDSGDQPALKIGEWLSFLKILVEDAHSQRHKNQRKEPLRPRKGGKRSAGIAYVGQVKQALNGLPQLPG